MSSSLVMDLENFTLEQPQSTSEHSRVICDHLTKQIPVTGCKSRNREGRLLGHCRGNMEHFPPFLSFASLLHEGVLTKSRPFFYVVHSLSSRPPPTPLSWNRHLQSGFYYVIASSDITE